MGPGGGWALPEECGPIDEEGYQQQQLQPPDQQHQGAGVTAGPVSNYNNQQQQQQPPYPRYLPYYQQQQVHSEDSSYQSLSQSFVSVDSSYLTSPDEDPISLGKIENESGVINDS